MHKMLHPKADVERLYIPRKDGGRGLIEVETAFKIATIGLDHYLKNKDRQHPKQVLEYDRSKAKNSMTKNVSGCEVLAKTEYISRHDKAAAYVHWNICQDHDVKVIDKWYEHKPESVTPNKDGKITIMWDMPVNTDRTITANRPDIIIKDSVNSTCKIIDMSIPSDRNIALKEVEKKKNKYRDLE